LTPQIAIIIPARNEELSLPGVLARLPAGIRRVVVVDNGSTDRTAEVAALHGALVVNEPVAGYGRACLAGLSFLRNDPPEIVAFVDADGSDEVSRLPDLIAPVVAGEADLVLGRRLPMDAAALSFQQRFGHILATGLIRLFWKHRFRDLGPMRVIRWTALERLNMTDRGFGWTVEMQVRALKQGLRIREIDVPYHQRTAGKSKISRTVSGTVKAGSTILWVIGRELVQGVRQKKSILASGLETTAVHPPLAPPIEGRGASNPLSPGGRGPGRGGIICSEKESETMQVFANPISQTGCRCLKSVFKGILVVVIIIVSSSSGAFAANLGLIDAETLKGSSSKWQILDARPKAEWEAGHIPGAIPFSWENYTRTDARGVEYSTFPPQELAAALAGLGIDEKSAVVVYGDADKSWGGEGYDVWLLSWLGHRGPIRLLNGGIQAWRSQKLPLVRGAEESAARKARYRVDLKHRYIVTTEEVLRGKGAYTLVDVRSTFEWIRGRIPGAVHIPWEDFYTGKDRHPLSAADLKRLLGKNGVDTSRTVVFYCLGGVRSAYAWMTSQLAGLPDAKNYKGGWAAWEKRE
jgi:thiosulfate/3-mercaptopyruvate sulfurtransferase